MVKPNYYIFNPSSTGSFEKQWHSCFGNFQHFLNGNPSQKAFVARVFAASENKQEFLHRAGEIKQAFSGAGIPYSLLPEPPEKPNLVMIEAGFASPGNAHAEYGQAGRVKFCKLSAPGYAEFWFAGVGGSHSADTIPGSAGSAFRQLQAAFLQLGLGFNQVVRQWNYVGQISGFQQIGLQQRQNYQLFNEARGEYYSRHRTAPDFPAATGIGIDYQGVILECLAVAGGEGLKIIAIGNPKQLDSYNYCQTVLKGEPSKGRASNQPPLFERAKLMTNGQSSRVFVSGTASIVGQETIGLGDVEKQTWVTIGNIETLTSKTNLESHCPGLAAYPDKYAYVRVYVKNEGDIPAVKAICLGHFGGAPMSFLKADICRAELLVEIEAEKIN